MQVGIAFMAALPGRSTVVQLLARAGRNLESGRKKQHNTSKEKGMTSLTRREALLFLAVACTSAQTVASERQWKSFLDWFSVLSPESFHTGPVLMMLYRRKMLAAGDCHRGR